MVDVVKFSAAKASVLIADDVQSIRSVLKSMLREMGFDHITEVANGKLALKALTNSQFDLVICDWEMPESNGMEILQKVRQSEKNRDCIFIMCTGNNDANLVKQAIAKGVTNYISKPFNQMTVTQKVAKYFNFSGN